MNQEQRYPISQYWNIDFLFYFFSKYCGHKIHLILISEIRIMPKPLRELSLHPLLLFSVFVCSDICTDPCYPCYPCYPCINFFIIRVCCNICFDPCYPFYPCYPCYPWISLLSLLSMLSLHPNLLSSVFVCSDICSDPCYPCYPFYPCYPSFYFFSIFAVTKFIWS